MENLQSHFNSCAANYERYAAPVLSSVADLFLEQIDWDGTGRALDLCAGTGVVLYKLAKRFPSALMLVGGDIAEKMLEVAQAKSYGDSRISLAVIDGEQVGFVSESFSLVI